MKKVVNKNYVSMETQGQLRGFLRDRALSDPSDKFKETEVFYRQLQSPLSPIWIDSSCSTPD